MKFALLAGRFILGAIFLYAGYVKLQAPWFLFAASIDSYQLLPSSLAIFLAHTLPWFEVVLGLALLSGFYLRWVALTGALVLLGFWLGMAQAYAKGLGIDCGCFGPGEKVSPLTLVRDGGMVALAAFLSYFAEKKR